MIKYKKFTRKELITWQEKNPVTKNNLASDMHLNYFQNTGMDDIVAIAAFDGEKLIGRNLLTYSNLLVKGKLLKFIVSKNLYVLQEYRHKSVGIFLKLHILQLGIPQISSAVSRQMQNVYDSWKDFRRIDSSFIFVIPLSFIGIINISRLSFYKKLRPSPQKSISLIFSLKKQCFNFIKFIFRKNKVSVIPSELAFEYLDPILNKIYFPIQVPWNKKKLEKALTGQLSDTMAWIVKIDTKDKEENVRYLITVYFKHKKIRLFGERYVEVKEAQVNEIYPPVVDKDIAVELLRFCAKNSRNFGADLLQVSALNECLESTCDELDLETFYKKSIYIAFKNLDEDLSAILSNPENWWCRAINENQFEEADLKANIVPHIT